MSLAQGLLLLVGGGGEKCNSAAGPFGTGNNLINLDASSSAGDWSGPDGSLRLLQAVRAVRHTTTGG